MYGIISIVSGITAVISGAVMGMKLRARYPEAGMYLTILIQSLSLQRKSFITNQSSIHFCNADALICGIGMLLSVPFFYGFLVAGLEPLYWIYILSFIALWFINLNWALVGDILLVRI